MKLTVKLILSATALTSGLLLGSINEATACSHLKNIGATDATNFPNLNLDQLDFNKIAAIALGGVTAVAAGLLLTRRHEEQKTATTQEDVFALSSFPIHIPPEALSSTTADEDELTLVK
ncbi:MAG: hypothetical protein DSM107014_11420 [Gomphosphaeria aponina SAG 52.96 = DSM 107014]|uniref:Gram-positive cocci surface proteins LPxTG domain-containing protein n=1 Tax=Gomphosphaeria aponina SAG 52.96 = DSM 107014 TaxID=1521640 RepID=A0A941GQJ2_9CHRO|nr:hypothetical protein [Gomphosphaeria aponina SAG 52.96 = DSM 107014]